MASTSLTVMKLQSLHTRELLSGASPTEEISGFNPFVYGSFHGFPVVRKNYAFQSLRIRELCACGCTRIESSCFNPYIQGNFRIQARLHLVDVFTIPIHKGTLYHIQAILRYEYFQSLHTRERFLPYGQEESVERFNPYIQGSFLCE